MHTVISGSSLCWNVLDSSFISFTKNNNLIITQDAEAFSEFNIALIEIDLQNSSNKLLRNFVTSKPSGRRSLKRKRNNTSDKEK